MKDGDDGATPDPDAALHANECMGKFAHKRMNAGPQHPEDQICMRCGERSRFNRATSERTIILAGAASVPPRPSELGEYFTPERAPKG